MAGWQTGLLVLVQSMLQHMHVVLPASTAANTAAIKLQTGLAKLFRSPLLAGREVQPMALMSWGSLPCAHASYQC